MILPLSCITIHNKLELSQNGYNGGNWTDNRFNVELILPWGIVLFYFDLRVLISLLWFHFSHNGKGKRSWASYREPFSLRYLLWVVFLFLFFTVGIFSSSVCCCKESGSGCKRWRLQEAGCSHIYHRRCTWSAPYKLHIWRLQSGLRKKPTGYWNEVLVLCTKTSTGFLQAGVTVRKGMKHPRFCLTHFSPMASENS